MPETDMEAEYNNRARVPGHAAIIAAWAREAAAYRAEARAEIDIAYGASPRARLDLFHPHRPLPDAPLAVFLHGGYWQALDKSFASHMARGANARGLAMAVPSYDLCPQARLEDIARQIAGACRFLHASLGRRLVLVGHSAGGHLAAEMLARQGRGEDAEGGPIAGALAISGLFDLEPLVETSINAALGLDPVRARALSPLRRPPRVGRLVAAVGGHESAEFRRQSRGIARAWSAAGLDTAYRQIDGANHFTAIASLAAPDGALTADLLALAEGRPL